MRKFILILALIPMLAGNTVSANYSVEKSDIVSAEFKTAENISETFEKSEGKEKLALAFNYFNREKFLSGHLLTDLYAVPPERIDTPYEPPIA